MKLGQNFCLGVIWDKYEKIRPLGQLLEKHCVCCRDQIFGLILVKLDQSFCLNEILNIVSSPVHEVRRVSYCDSAVCVVNFLLDVHSRGHIIMKLGQNVCLDEVKEELENGLCRVKNLVTKSNLRKTLCTLLQVTF